jgi:hypothetical protein
MPREFEPSLRAIFQETLFGPEEIDLTDEFAEDYAGVPNLKVCCHGDGPGLILWRRQKLSHGRIKTLNTAEKGSPTAEMET